METTTTCLLAKSQQIELRKWCFEQAKRATDEGSSTVETAQKLFDWVTEGKMPETKTHKEDQPQ